MTADKALEIIAWVKDRRDYRRACGLRRPADEAADTAAEDRAYPRPGRPADHSRRFLQHGGDAVNLDNRPQICYTVRGR